MWGGTDEEQSVRAIRASLDAGVNFIDTAPAYGLGLSERIVGEAIQDDDIVVQGHPCRYFDKCRPVGSKTNRQVRRLRAQNEVFQPVARMSEWRGTCSLAFR